MPVENLGQAVVEIGGDLRPLSVAFQVANSLVSSSVRDVSRHAREALTSAFTGAATGISAALAGAGVQAALSVSAAQAAFKAAHAARLAEIAIQTAAFMAAERAKRAAIVATQTTETAAAIATSIQLTKGMRGGGGSVRHPNFVQEGFDSAASAAAGAAVGAAASAWSKIWGIVTKVGAAIASVAKVVGAFAASLAGIVTIGVGLVAGAVLFRDRIREWGTGAAAARKEIERLDAKMKEIHAQNMKDVKELKQKREEALDDIALGKNFRERINSANGPETKLQAENAALQAAASIVESSRADLLQERLNGLQAKLSNAVSAGEKAKIERTMERLSVEEAIYQIEQKRATLFQALFVAQRSNNAEAATAIQNSLDELEAAKQGRRSAFAVFRSDAERQSFSPDIVSASRFRFGAPGAGGSQSTAQERVASRMGELVSLVKVWMGKTGFAQ